MIDTRTARVFERENGTRRLRWYISVNKNTRLPFVTDADLTRFPVKSNIECAGIFEGCSLETAFVNCVNA